jgi:ubiquinone biosynthesis protein COQ4
MTSEQDELSPDLRKFVQGFATFANNPNRTDAVFQMADGLRHTELYQHFIEYAHADTEVDRILQERYLATEPDLNALLHYPAGSLGECYARSMVNAQLDPNFYPKLVIEDDYSYIAIRLRQTHDIWHIVTGFGTDLGGEMALQAFTLAQTHSPLAVAILSSSIVHMLKVSGPLNAIVGNMQQGWNIGIQAKPFLAQKWEEAWEKPLVQWRLELNVAMEQATSGE